MGPRPVPQRPAPPRPSASSAAPRRAARGPGTDLMEFSPEKDALPDFAPHEDDFDFSENMEVVEDLENRIQEAVTDRQKYQLCREDLAETLSVADPQERLEVEENLVFYDANIEGLTKEIADLKATLNELRPSRVGMATGGGRHTSEDEERARDAARRHQAELQREARENAALEARRLREKRQETRLRVIAEMLATEESFLKSLSLCFETFFNTDAYKCQSIDVDALFGNMDEVMEVSQQLLTSLESATNGKDFGDQLIGPCFVELTESMKKVYAPYCRNHDDVLALLDKYERDPEIQAVFAELVETMKTQSGVQVFDLSSVLIKPVQRILKYPLLLNELNKSTEEDHADKLHLLTAINAMTDVAAAINEYKRRKDLVLKYKNTSDVKLSEKFSKFNVHSTKKKFYRLSQMMIGPQTVDENFNREERKFKLLDSMVRTFVKDISVYLELVQAAVATQEVLANDISDYYGERSSEQEVERYCSVLNQIATGVLSKFKEEVEKNVITPLNKLVLMFQGPSKVIRKRYDKLLDYDNINSRVKNLRDNDQLRSAREDLQKATVVYEALNSQLLDELPQLYALSLDVVRQCVANLLQAQQRLYNSVLEQMYQLLGLQLLLGSDERPLLDTFHAAHSAVVERLSELTFIPRAFNPRLEERRSSTRGSSRRSIVADPRGGAGAGAGPGADAADAATAQSDSQKAYLRERYGDRLFYVKHDVPGSPAMDLALTQGSFVGVIKEGDPMGNKDRWFVDSGTGKGFVLKRYLTPAKPGALADPPAVGVGDSVDSLLSMSPPRADTVKPPPAFGFSMSDLLTTTLVPEAGALIDPMPAVSTTSPGPLPSPLTPKATEALSSGSQSHCATNVPASANHSQDPPSYDQSVDDDPQTFSQSADEAQPLPEMSADQEEAYQAVYSFHARSPIEANLVEGQPVRVLQHHDLDGNREWWLVESGGGQGYVPASYLYRMQ